MMMAGANTEVNSARKTSTVKFPSSLVRYSFREPSREADALDISSASHQTAPDSKSQPHESISPFEGIRKHLTVDNRVLRRSEARYLSVTGLHHDPNPIRSLRKVHGVVGTPKI